MQKKNLTRKQKDEQGSKKQKVSKYGEKRRVRLSTEERILEKEDQL